MLQEWPIGAAQRRPTPQGVNERRPALPLSLCATSVGDSRPCPKGAELTAAQKSLVRDAQTHVTTLNTPQHLSTSLTLPPCPTSPRMANDAHASLAVFFARLCSPKMLRTSLSLRIGPPGQHRPMTLTLLLCRASYRCSSLVSKRGGLASWHCSTPRSTTLAPCRSATCGVAQKAPEVFCICAMPTGNARCCSQSVDRTGDCHSSPHNVPIAAGHRSTSRKLAQPLAAARRSGGPAAAAMPLNVLRMLVCRSVSSNIVSFASIFAQCPSAHFVV